MRIPQCRFCDTELVHTFVDLGMLPLANSYLSAEQLSEMEPFYPLHARVCHNCFLAQVEEFETPERLFSDYAYLSSYSESWLAHARRYVEEMTERLALDANSLVIEIASNDGYLLQYFVARGVPVLGIEPAANAARLAEEKRVPTLGRFFGRETARELAGSGKKADLLLGNNVLAHVPQLNDFVAGLGMLLKADGVITMEFPHLARLIEFNQFDTIYHEHFSYLSLYTVQKVFERHGLRICDVEELPTHGGSLRIFACHAGSRRLEVSDQVAHLLDREKEQGIDGLELYRGFTRKVEESKRALLEFLIPAKRQGKRVVSYGAPAKGNTLLNYCGIGRDFLDFTVDRSPLKQGRFLPGTHIPIHAPDRIREARPDYVLILPWNLREEVMSQMAEVRGWGGRFVVAIPRLEVLH